MHHLAVMHMEQDPEKAEQLLRRMLDERCTP
jgi:pentatricopeptide repeat protein